MTDLWTTYAQVTCRNQVITLSLIKKLYINSFVIHTCYGHTCAEEKGKASKAICMNHAHETMQFHSQINQITVLTNLISMLCGLNGLLKQFKKYLIKQC